MRDTRDQNDTDPNETVNTGGDPSQQGTDQPGNEHPEHEQPETEAPDEPTGMSAEEAEEFVAAARAGEETPVGAEGYAEALALVAAQRDEQFDKFQRLAADYQNFQRRARLNEKEGRELASMGVVQSLLQVLDFFDMALKQDPDTATAAQVIGGVEMIKSEFLRVLGNQGVKALVPQTGEEFDPLRHEAIERTEQTNVEPGRVVETRTPGYSIGDRMMRPAKVVISAQPDGQAGGQPEDGADGDTGNSTDGDA